MDQDDKFYINIMKMEVERVKFILASYLRARLQKIEKHLLYVVEKDLSGLLSQEEKNFAFSLYTARKNFFNQNLFDKIGKSLNCIDVESIDNRLSKYQQQSLHLLTINLFIFFYSYQT